MLNATKFFLSDYTYDPTEHKIPCDFVNAALESENKGEFIISK